MKATQEEQDPLVGTLVLGRYRVVRPLARGGMGMIYLARLEGAAGFSKPVVIKQVLSHLDGYEEARAQFIREARILSELHHPGIVGVLDFGEEANAYVMALEYVHGFHLGQWLRFSKKARGKMDWEHAVYVTLRVLEAVHYAHTRVDQAGTPRVIIHRDISPGNILIDLQGNVRLLDFGIARAVGDKGEHQTREGVVKGKLSYIAPEIYGSQEANPSTDVYAVGVVLYQLLAGKNPFVGKDMSDTIGRVLSGRAPPLSHYRPDVPQELSKVITTAIAKNPELRFATADEFSVHLAATLGRRQSEVAADFRRVIAADFEEKLPSALELSPLSVLDSAWRKSGSNPAVEKSLLQSSLPPATEESSQHLQVPPHSPMDPNLTGITRAIQTPAFENSGSVLAPVEPTTATQELSNAALIGAQSKGAGARVIVLSMIGASVIAAGVAALVLSLNAPSSQTEGKQRYLVVDRREADPPKETLEPDEAAAPVSPAPAPAPTPPSQAVKAPETFPSKPAAGATPSGDSKKTGVAALTQAFSRRAGSVQSCFTKNAGDLQGTPQISIRFEVSATGKVNSATLSPTALAGTSVGRCVLAVAKGTPFPAGDRTVAFSIPITARVVKN